MRNQLLKIAVLMAVLSLVLSACGPKVVPATAAPVQANDTPVPSSPVPTEKKIITFAWTQEPNTLNRSYSAMWYMSTLIQIYSCSPWQGDENNGYYPYMLTELPTISEDGLVVTMHLRDDLKWSDGVPITADDFVFTYDMITNPANKVNSTYPYDMFTVSSPDPLTVIMTFTKVFTPWMATLWSGTIMPKHILQPVFDSKGTIDTAEWNMAPTVGCGPFTFTKWESGSYLRFDRNENYWGTPAKLDAVIFQFVPDDAAQTAACLAGTVDVCFWPPYEDIPALRAAGLRVITEPSGYNEGWFFNLRPMASPGIRDLNVRKAIAMALDRESNTDLRMNVVKVNETFWDALPAYVDPSITPWPYDPEAARKLLEQSGWIDRNGDGIREDANGNKLIITMGTNIKTERQNYQALAQQQLLAVGIDLKTSSYESGLGGENFSQGGPVATGTLDIWEQSDAPAFPDPDTSEFLCDQVPSDANPFGFNYWFCDPTLDALFKQQIETVDPEARMAIFHQITRYMHDNVYYLGIWQDPDVWILNPRITGYKFSGLTPLFNIMDWDVIP